MIDTNQIYRIGKKVCPAFYAMVTPNYIDNDFTVFKTPVIFVVNFKDYIVGALNNGYIPGIGTRKKSDYLNTYNFIRSYELNDAYKEQPICISSARTCYSHFLLDTALVMLKMINNCQEEVFDVEVTVIKNLLDKESEVCLTFNPKQDKSKSNNKTFKPIEDFSIQHLRKMCIENDRFADRLIDGFDSRMKYCLDNCVRLPNLMQYFKENTDTRSEVIGKAFLYIYLGLNALNFVPNEYRRFKRSE